jgi:predicted DNA-binding transcriptional regulator YafY
MSKAKGSDSPFRRSIDMFFRISAIKRRLKEKPIITHINQLKSFLEDEGFANISVRNIQRDLNSLREHFGVNAGYNPALKRYVIEDLPDDDPDLTQFESLIDMAEQYRTKLNKVQGALDGYEIIRFEHQDSLLKIKPRLTIIAQAIKQKEVISFFYRPFGQTEEREWNLEPYLVLENKNRWYVIGLDIASKSVRTFGLERILAIENTYKKFDSIRNFNYNEIKSKNYGIYNIDAEPTAIVLRFSKLQGHYLVTNPIHTSQVELPNFEGEGSSNSYTYLQLNLIPNPDFYMQLMSYHAECKVLSPVEIQKTVVEMTKKMLEQYSINTDTSI